MQSVTRILFSLQVASREKIANRDLLVRADIKDFAETAIQTRHRQKSPARVVDERKVAHCRQITKFHFFYRFARYRRHLFAASCGKSYLPLDERNAYQAEIRFYLGRIAD
jgi:hypothetical protein